MKNIFIPLLTVVVLMSACKKEEEVVQQRDVQEQAIEDSQTIEAFLESHYYNYEDFQDPDFKDAIVFDTLSGNNSTKTPLINQVIKKIISVKTSDGSFVDHNLYYLVAREGVGASPSSVDSTYLSYEGLLTNKFVFDSSTSPVWFDLTQVVRGFREAMPNFKAGEYTVNEDNTIAFSGYGQGAFFIPSGLGYFSSTAGSIPAYSPLIFKVNLFVINETDHDGDGIPSSQEYDNDGDGVQDDTDGDGIPDYLDAN